MPDSGIIAPVSAFDELVKAEAEKLARAMSKQAHRSTFFSEYALAQNMIVHGAREKPIGTPSIELLYMSAERSFVDRILIRARIDQQKRIWKKAEQDGDIGFKVVHDLHHDKEFEVTDEIRRRCNEVTDLLLNPTPDKFVPFYPNKLQPHVSLKDLIARLVKAELIIDRKAIQLYPRYDGKGVAAFHWLPGETIKNVDEMARSWAMENEAKGEMTKFTLEKMSNEFGKDFTTATHVQVVDGQIREVYSKEQISVHISNPSDRINRWGYGESRLEDSLDVTACLLYAWQYNKQLFETNYPEQVLMISGEYDKEGLNAFKQQIMSEVGPGKTMRLPILSSLAKPDSAEAMKIEAKKLREAPKDMLFDQLFRFLIYFKCAAYGTHPSVLNFGTDSGGGQHLFGQGQEPQMEQSKDFGLKPSLEDTAEWFTRVIVKPMYPDLKLIITGMEVDDEEKKVKLRTERVKSWKSRNEIRMEEGDDPVGDMNDPNNLWNLPADPAMMNAVTQQQMFEGEPGEEPGQPQEENGHQLFEPEVIAGGKAGDSSTERPAEPIKKAETTKFLNLTI
jgi:hypothetical protein